MIQDRVRETAAQRVLFLPHAIRQMNKPERMISAVEVREVVLLSGTSLGTSEERIRDEVLALSSRVATRDGDFFR